MLPAEQYSRASVNKAGDILISSTAKPDEYGKALQVLNDWRALHFVPLFVLQQTLSQYVDKITNRGGIVAQRLKRVPTILDKIKNRQKTMKLSQMQDIGGLRAIVPDIKQVREIERLYTENKEKHYVENKDDYIETPKKSGYRGIHLKCRYRSPADKKYDGLKIEIQLRTKLQHLWATAVETAGFFIQESLKSSQGSEDWLDFFKLVSAIFALEENEKPHSDFLSLTKDELVKRLIQFDKEHKIFSRLRTIQIIKSAKNYPELSKYAYWVIETILNGSSSTKIYSFLEEQEEIADLTYRQLEQTLEFKEGKKQVVLISLDSVTKIEKAYPNFFGNIDDFIKELEQIIHINISSKRGSR